MEKDLKTFLLLKKAKLKSGVYCS